MRRPLVAAGGCAALCALALATIAFAEDIDCAGGGAKCNGTPFEDTITGTSKKDGIDAKAGNDEVYAGGGNDTIELGAGIDYVEAGKGDDKVSGGDDDDIGITGGLFGGKGDDIVTGGDGHDDLYGDDGKDTLVGGDGDDQLVGAGAAVNDDGSKDELTCGPGFDTAIVGRKDKVDQSCEDVIQERR